MPNISTIVNLDGFRKDVYHLMNRVCADNPLKASDLADRVLTLLALSIKH